MDIGADSLPLVPGMEVSDRIRAEDEDGGEPMGRVQGVADLEVEEGMKKSALGDNFLLGCQSVVWQQRSRSSS